MGTRYLLSSVTVLALSAAAAAAGGVEWSDQSVGILFDKGRQVQFSLGYVSPHVSGTSLPAYGSQPSGNMVKSYTPFKLGFRMPLNANTDVAFVIDQPIGAKVAYPAGTSYPVTGSTGNIDSTAYTLMARYRFPSNLSLYGGIRVEQAKGDVTLTAPIAYTMQTSTSTEPGFLMGVAYEIPKIAGRVSLTYNSQITHTFSVTENGSPSLAMSTTVPKSWDLEFQTGVAPKTLLFGGVKWRNWKAFNITPAGYYAALNSALVDYSTNSVTLKLGVGHQFTDTWSGAVSLGYERHTGTQSGNLGPTDGYKSISVAAIYTKDKIKVTTGVSYIKIGDTFTSLGTFSGNHAFAAGVKVGYSF